MDYPVKTCCFFKIILSDITSDTKLMIPRKFARKYEKNLDSSVSLKDPNGLVWPVNLGKHKGEVFFHNGLLEFARFYSIHFGQILVFEYQGHSEFQVLIFDSSSTEIDYPLTTSDNYNLEESIKVRKSVCEIAKTTTLDPKSPPENTIANFASKDANVKRAHLLPELQQEKGNTNSKLPRVKTEAEDSRVVTSFSDFKSNNCFLTVKLSPSYIYGGSLSLSKEFVKRYITKDHCDVVLQVSHGRTWSVKCSVYKTCAKFNAGWMEFARANDLAVGDICVFELLSCSQKLFNVVIYPTDGGF